MAKQKNEPKRQQQKTAAVRKTTGLESLPLWFTNRRLHMAVIFGFSFLLYVNTLGFDYAQDDAIVITDNMFTAKGLAGIPGILKYDTFYGFFKEEGKANLVSGGRYRPLSLITFALEVALFGQSPFVSHLVNALLYGATAVLLYWVLLQWFMPGPPSPGLRRAEEDAPHAYFVALAGALLFAAHPLHTEAVANIKGRDEILALLGSLGAVSLSFRAFRESRPLWNLAAGAVFLLALFSKENAITFLAVVPLAYFFFTRAAAGAIIRQTLPFAAAAALFLVARGAVLHWSSLTAVSGELMNNPFLKVEGNRYVPFSAGEKLATIVYTLGKYVQLLFVPHPLTHDYYPRHIGVMSWSDGRALGSLLLYLFLGAYALRGLPRRDPVSFGILFFLATISIVSNLVFPVGTNMSERFAYMPSVGFALAFAVMLYRLTLRLAPQRRLSEFRNLYPALAVTGVFLLFFGARTIARNPVWQDNYTLFSTDVKTSPNSAKLRNAIGGELVTRSVDEKDESRRRRMLLEAVGHLEAAVRIHPNYKNAYLLLGNACYYLKDWEKAIRYYQQALTLDSAYEEARNNLGITYRDAGRDAGESKGDVAGATRYLEQAYALRPNEYETVRLLAVAYGFAGNSAKALPLFEKAVQLDPDNADAVYNLGTAYHQAGQPERGNELYRRAIEMDPEVEKRMKGGQ